MVSDLCRSCSEVSNLNQIWMYHQSFVNVLSAKFHVIYFHRVLSFYIRVRGKTWRSQWTFWYSFDFECARKIKYESLQTPPKYSVQQHTVMSRNSVLHVSVRTKHHEALMIRASKKNLKYILACNCSVSEISQNLAIY